MNAPVESLAEGLPRGRFTVADVVRMVEVADSSLGYDLNCKPLIYAAFGVTELWVVDAVCRVVHRFAEPCLDGHINRTRHGADERLTRRRRCFLSRWTLCPRCRSAASFGPAEPCD